MHVFRSKHELKKTPLTHALTETKFRKKNQKTT